MKIGVDIGGTKCAISVGEHTKEGIEITDKKVSAKLYTDKSGKPVHTVILKDKSK